MPHRYLTQKTATMSLPDMQPVSANVCQQTWMTYHDGSRRLVCWSHAEVPVPDDLLIVSRTNSQGIITHVNDALVAMSGYSRQELIGQPHCVLRHPDMPAAVFRGMWNDCQAGLKWNGYVKNLQRTGTCYWIHATVVPNIRKGVVVGYTSVQRKPSRLWVDAVIPMYQRFLVAEADQRVSSQEGGTQ